MDVSVNTLTGWATGVSEWFGFRTAFLLVLAGVLAWAGIKVFLFADLPSEDDEAEAADEAQAEAPTDKPAHPPKPTLPQRFSAAIKAFVNPKPAGQSQKPAPPKKPKKKKEESKGLLSRLAAWLQRQYPLIEFLALKPLALIMIVLAGFLFVQAFLTGCRHDPYSFENVKWLSTDDSRTTVVLGQVVRSLDGTPAAGLRLGVELNGPESPGGPLAFSGTNADRNGFFQVTLASSVPTSSTIGHSVRITYPRNQLANGNMTVETTGALRFSISQPNKNTQAYAEDETMVASGDFSSEGIMRGRHYIWLLFYDDEGSYYLLQRRTRPTRTFGGTWKSPVLRLATGMIGLAAVWTGKSGSAVLAERGQRSDYSAFDLPDDWAVLDRVPVQVVAKPKRRAKR